MDFGIKRRRTGSVLVLAGAFLVLVAGFMAMTEQPAVAVPGGGGNPPDVECAELEALSSYTWNGEYWKIQVDDGVINFGDIETNVPGAVTGVTLIGGVFSWTNNNANAAFGWKEKGGQADDFHVGYWPFGTGDSDPVGGDLSHVIICFTGDTPPTTTTTTVPPTTTTTTVPPTTTTTTVPQTTTTIAGPTTTTTTPPTTTTTVPPTTTSTTIGGPTTTTTVPRTTTTSTPGTTSTSTTVAGPSTLGTTTTTIPELPRTGPADGGQVPAAALILGGFGLLLIAAGLEVLARDASRNQAF